jgi:hypothetical protein
MSEGNSAASFAEARTKLSEIIESHIKRSGNVAAQLDKTLISLSAGALVFSMTFVGIFAPGKLLLPLLFFAWSAFAACLTFVIFAMRAEQNAINKAMQNFDMLLKELDKNEPLASVTKLSVRLTRTVSTTRRVLILNRSAIGAFMIGVLLLGLFVGYNLWQSPKTAKPVPNKISLAIRQLKPRHPVAGSQTSLKI